MSITNYKDPIIPDWKRDENGNKISELVTNEQKQIIGNRIILDYLPDIQQRVFINKDFVEIDIKEKITETNQFKVNYEAGYITVHESLDGQFLTIEKYYGRGVIFYPASRVWTKLSVDGEVVQTVDGAINILDNQSINITGLQGVRIYEGTTQPTDTRFWYDPTDS